MNNKTNSQEFWTLLAYVLYLIPLSPIFGCIIAWVNRKKPEETLYDHHFAWLITTFWLLVAINIIGFITIGIIMSWQTAEHDSLLTVVSVGYVATRMFYYYRVIKGIVLLCRSKPIKNNFF